MAVQERNEMQSYAGDQFIQNNEDYNLDKKYLTFTISDKVYGIDIRDITDIIEIKKITSVPDLPVYMAGMIKLRGNIIPIMDLRIKFNIEKREYNDWLCVVIVNINNNSTGFIVDKFLELVDIPYSKIDSHPQFETDFGYEKYVAGIGKLGDEVKILLDTKKVITGVEFEGIGLIQ